jgi:uncharacterized protein with von Willebrand factor type A (vWA) domain
MTAVVVIFDRSLSMPMNDLFGSAQTRAIETLEALESPASSDHLHALVAFGARAALMEPSQVAELTWDYDYGSNLEEALRLSESTLNGRPGRIVLLSDLFPCAHTDDQDNVVFQCPPAQETLDRTVDAVRSCRDASITIEAIRYRSGETPDKEESIVAVVLEAILRSGGTWKTFASPIHSPMVTRKDRHRTGPGATAPDQPTTRHTQRS